MSKSYKTITVSIRGQTVTYDPEFMSLASGAQETLGPWDWLPSGKDNVGIAYQRYHLMSDGETLVIVGSAEGHGNPTDNATRYIRPVEGVWGRFQPWGANGNFRYTYNNHARFLIPASAMHDPQNGDALFWPSKFVWRSGPNSDSHGGKNMHRGNTITESMFTEKALSSITNEVNPVVTASVVAFTNPAQFPYNQQLRGYVHCPSMPSIHDKIFPYQYISGTQIRALGIDTTNDPVFSAPGAGTSAAFWFESASEIWSGPVTADFCLDSLALWEKPGGSSHYNPFSGWSPSRQRWYIWGGTSGDNSSYIMVGYYIEKNPNYPATQPQPWRVVQWPVSNSGIYLGVSQTLSGGVLVEGVAGHADSLYMAGGTRGDVPQYPVQKAYRIRLDTNTMEALPDVPDMGTFPIASNNPPTWQPLLVYAPLVHHVIFIGPQLYALDVLNLSAGWVDITPPNWTPVGAASGDYIAAMDAIVFRLNTNGYGTPTDNVLKWPYAVGKITLPATIPTKPAKSGVLKVGFCGQSNGQRAFALGTAVATPTARVWSTSVSVNTPTGQWKAMPATAQGASRFAERLDAFSGRASIDLYDGAVGGSQIASWVGGQANMNSFLAAVAANGDDLDAVIWIQGEEDGRIGTSQTTYQNRLWNDANSVIKTLRANITNRSGQPNLPIIITTLGRGLTTSVGPDANVEAIRAAQRAIIATVPDVYLGADCASMNLSDGVHYDAASQDKLGVRLAQTLLYVMGKANYYRGPRITSASKPDATHIYVDITHTAGQDYAPITSIPGFEVVDNGVTLVPTAAIRILTGNAESTRIRLTMAAALVGPTTVQFMSGSDGGVTFANTYANPVLDNTALQLPLESVVNIPVN